MQRVDKSTKCSVEADAGWRHLLHNKNTTLKCENVRVWVCVKCVSRDAQRGHNNCTVSLCNLNGVKACKRLQIGHSLRIIVVWFFKKKKKNQHILQEHEYKKAERASTEINYSTGHLVSAVQLWAFNGLPTGVHLFFICDTHSPCADQVKATPCVSSYREVIMFLCITKRSFIYCHWWTFEHLPSANAILLNYSHCVLSSGKNEVLLPEISTCISLFILPFWNEWTWLFFIMVPPF